MIGLGLPNLEDNLVTLIFAMLRTGAAFVAVPIFSAVSVPLQVRVALAGAIGVMVMGVHDLRPPMDPLSLAGIVIMAQEIMVGLSLGFILQIAFAAPMMAGEYISTSIGLGFAGMVDPQNSNQSPVLGQFLMILMTLMFLSLDGHLVLLEVIVRSYALWPLGGAWIDRDQLWEVVRFGGFIFASGLLIALPVGFALFGLNLLVGMMTRAAPQLNIFAVGMPITLMTGLVVLSIAFPSMAQLMMQAAETAMDQMRDFLVTR